MRSARSQGTASRLKAALLYTLYSVAAALVVLAAAETLLRISGVGHAEAAVDRPSWMDDESYALFRAWTDAVGLDLSDVGDLQGWQWDPRLRWSLRPDLDMPVRNIFLDPALGSDATWRLRTNSQGYRTPEFQREKPPGTFRVVTIGDSNTMGWLLDAEDSYARRLEDRLAERLPGPVEVINLGVGGYTSFGCRTVFETEALPLDPDALVVSCGGNDDQPMGSTDAEYARAHAGWLGRLRRALSGLRLVAVLQRLRPASEAKLVPRTTPAQFGENLSGIFDEAARRDIPVVFLRVCCCAPARLRVLARTAARHGTPVVFAGEVLARASPSQLRESHGPTLARIRDWYPEEELEDKPWLDFLYRDGCHLNPLGSELVAEALAAKLAGPLRDASDRGPTDP